MADGKVTISTALDNKGFEKGIKSVSGIFGGLAKTVATTTVAITAAFATAAAAITKQAVEAYADYEQLTGGVETLFKSSADKVKKYAEDAFYTVGISANEYMETVTSFSASLISSLGGDTDKAADVANTALIDMADNANKMGSSLESVQTAYQGFAKQQYQLLDNLKLGYGGTKTEMERLLKDAEAFSGVKYDINNLGDVYEAIHQIQIKLDIAGTTAKEAEKTITGSANMTKAAWKNTLAAIAGGGDLDKAINNLVYSISKYFENIVPVVERSLAGIGQLIEKIGPRLVQTVATALIKAIPSLLNAVYQMIIGLAKGVYQGIMALFSGSNASSEVSAQLNGVAESAGAAADAEQDLADGITEASKAAKKSLAGFDELNVLQDSSASSDSSSSQAIAPNFSVDDWATDSQLQTIKDNFEEIAKYIGIAAAGIAGFKLGSFITDLLTANIEAKTLKESIGLLGKKAGLTTGITLAITGGALETKGIVSTIQEGLNSINFAEIVGGGGMLAGGGALIGQFFGSAILGGAIGGIVAGIPAFITGIYDAVVGGIDWLNAALIGAGATAAGAGIGAIIGMVGGPIGAGIGALIGLAVGLVTDLVILIVQKWDEICAWFSGVGAWFDENVIQPVAGFFSGLWESISQWASDAWERIKEFFAPAIEWFSELFGSIWQTISDIFYNIGVIASGCWEIIKAVWDIVAAWFDENVIQPVVGFFVDLWESVSSWAIQAWDDICAVFSSIATWINENVIQPVAGFFSDLWADISGWAEGVWEDICDVFGGIVDFFKGILNGIIEALNSGLSWVFGGINDILQGIKDFEILGKQPFARLKTVHVPQIPLLAQGAVLPPNKPFMAVVGDQRHGTNIEAPLATIQEAVALVMQDQTNAILAGFETSVGVQKEILEAVLGIQIGDDVIGNAVARYNRKCATMTGGAV